MVVHVVHMNAVCRYQTRIYYWDLRHVRDGVHTKTVCWERDRSLDLIHHRASGMYVKLLGYRQESLPRWPNDPRDQACMWHVMAVHRWFQLRIPREGVDLKMATKMSYGCEEEVGGNPTGVGVKSSSQKYGYRRFVGTQQEGVFTTLW
jgi:hypothetical protein